MRNTHQVQHGSYPLPSFVGLIARLCGADCLPEQRKGLTMPRDGSVSEDLRWGCRPAAM